MRRSSAVSDRPEDEEALPNPSRAPAQDAWMQSFGWLVAALLLALRLPHLGGPLDDPHSWRQCDTAHYSLDFYRRGFDLMHPAVCWLGGHRTLIFEFPLPEALSALLYRAFGPSPVWDRVVSLVFFAIAAGYLRAFLGRVAGRRIAALATLAFLALPLGRYFSRAAHVDFVATAFAHAMLYHGLRGVRERAWSHTLAAGAAGALAALIKAPYLIPVLGPFAVAALSIPLGAALAPAGVPLALTAAAFVWWRRHVDGINAAVPDWSFLPGFYREVNPGWWYYGEWSQRLVPGNWLKLARRVLHEVTTPGGLGVALLGLTHRPRAAARGPGAWSFALAWCAGTALYVLVFFPLNLIHDYYQIPLLAPAAFLIALGADRFWDRLPRAGAIPVAGVLFAALLAALALARPAGYYRVDWLRVEAGRRIAARVPPGDLVVACDYGAGWSDPRLLFRADREGWSVAVPDLTPDRLVRLRAAGARWAAIVTDPDHPALRAPDWLTPARVTSEPVVHAGRAVGALELYDLARLGDGGAR